MTGSIFIYFPLIAAIVGIIDAWIFSRLLYGKIGRNIAFFLLMASGWSLFIFIEIFLENNILNPSLFENTLPDGLNLIRQLFDNNQQIFMIIKSASTLAGFFAMFIVIALLRISLNFPPRQLVLKWDIMMLLLAGLMGIPSWYGVHFELTKTGIVRQADTVIYIQLVYVIIVCTFSQVILFKKSKDFSSPLRSLQARFIPQALLIAMLIGAGFGYLAAFMDEVSVLLVVATSAPLLFTLLVLTSLAYSRQIFGKTFDYTTLQKQLLSSSSFDEKYWLLRSHDIQISLYKKSAPAKYQNLNNDIYDVLKIPEQICLMSNSLKKPWFFSEDFDDVPDSEACKFIASQYAQAGIFYKNHLLLIHRIKNNKIIKVSDLEFLGLHLIGDETS